MERVKKDLFQNYQIVKDIDKTDEIEVPAHYGYGVRHLQMLLLFVCLIVEYASKSHLGVTIVAMTSGDNRSSASDVLLSYNSSDYDYEGGIFKNYTQGIMNETVYSEGDKSWNVYRTYPWPKSVQEMALSSFTLGYVVMLFPMGAVVQRWGGKVALQIALLMNGVASIPIPWLTVWGGWKALCICRILQGLSQSGLSAGVHTIIANWVPLGERCRTVGFIYVGPPVGIVVAFQLSGLLSSSWGWPSIYWLTGIMNLGLFAAVSFFLAATPFQHKFISTAEKNFITERTNTGLRPKQKIPWKALVSSMPLWAVLVSDVCCVVAFTFLYQQLPTYFHHVLGVSIQSSGLLSSLPFIVSCFASMLYGTISDFLTNRNIISVRTARIIFNSIGEFGIALCLTLCSFVTSAALATACITTTVTLFAAIHAGGMLGYMDIAPNYIGPIMAIGSTVGYAMQLLTPVLVSHVVVDMTNQLQWRTVLLIISGMAFVGNVFYIIFISADVEPWNSYHYTTKETEETKSLNGENERVLEKISSGREMK